MSLSILKSRFLQSAAILVATASAAAAAENTTPANVNVLNLLSPFLSLDTSTTDPTTLLQTNLANTIAINNNTTAAQQSLAISDKNLLGGAINTVTGIPSVVKFGVAANLGGGLPPQAAINGITPTQAVGGLGTQLGALYAVGVNAYANGNTAVLPNTVSLLTKAYSFTSSDLGVSKFYFANGTIDGTTTAVAPSGYTLPAHNGLPKTANSVYDLAYGVKNTDPGQNIYGSSRPVQVRPNQINAFDPTALNGLATNPAFPSGHANYAFTDSTLLAMMVPEQYQSMLLRGSEYGNSRIALGVHYALDIIASRSFSAYDLAQGLTNPAYINNAATTGTAIDLPSLIKAAAPELRSYLASGCGASIASCATSAANTSGNPYVPSADNLATYTARLTYGLPTLSKTAAPAEAAPADGPDAAILLATLYGGSSAAAHALGNAVTGGADGSGVLGGLATSTIDQIVMNTETNAIAAFYGTDLSYWSRINLYAAAGYFGDVTGTLKTADGDRVKTDVTVGSGGVIDITGLLKVDGDFDLEAGGVLGFIVGGPPGTDSELEVGKTADLVGVIGVLLAKGTGPEVGDAFDLVEATQGVTDAISGLTFNGGACSFVGGDTYSCGHNILLSVFANGGTGLTLKVDAVPEPATWALMLAGFAGLGFAAYRRRAPARAIA